MNHHLRPNPTGPLLLEVTPATAGWRYLHFRLIALALGQHYRYAGSDCEVAVTPVSGAAEVLVGRMYYQLRRDDVFTAPPQVLYVPPGEDILITARSACELALGGAPAVGKYPPRLFQSEAMRYELRGGGPALRQVNHILAAPLPAERLILYEAYVPGGAWSGWPPHCHDGYAGSPYLEEVYYYRFRPTFGFGIHRNYCRDEPFDEVFAVRHGEAVLVTKGFHPTTAAPGATMYFLNYLAGDLYDEARATPPVDDPDFAWMKQDWEGGRLPLPVPYRD
jgi:5-deoxy-glucuronate isomerase